MHACKKIEDKEQQQILIFDKKTKKKEPTQNTFYNLYSQLNGKYIYNDI